MKTQRAVLYEIIENFEDGCFSKNYMVVPYLRNLEFIGLIIWFSEVPW